MMSTSVATIYYILHTTERKKKKKGSIYKSKDPARTLCPGLCFMLLLERRRKACHRQSYSEGSGGKAHPLRVIEFNLVKAE